MRDQTASSTDRCSLPQRLQRRWNDLCAEYLPVIDNDSIWRYSRTSAEGDLEQGWKLHVSATIFNAPHILDRIAPVLVECGVQFKAARSLDDVLSLNSGLLKAYSQVGKIITVYPRNDDETIRLAECLHNLTYRFRGPLVPFDLRFRVTSNVYYRYGAFTKMELEQNGMHVQCVMTPRGELVPDLRENPKPDWVADPFRANCRDLKLREQKSPISSSYRVMRALVQRGKGGVYQAIDFQSTPPRLCLLKEGRRHGELNWDGRDGAWRVRHEQRVLSRLSRCGIKVPRVYARFEMDGNFYLAMEYISGESLYNFLQRQKRRLPMRKVLSFGIDIATLLAQMHGAGWAWRDCKPSNLIVSGNGHLVPVDFEGAERTCRPDLSLWGTPGFMPRASRAKTASGLTDDLYALGSLLFLLISGQMFDDTRPTPIGSLRRNVPVELRLVVESLLVAKPERRPRAARVQLELTSILSRCLRRVSPLPVPAA